MEKVGRSFDCGSVTFTGKLRESLAFAQDDGIFCSHCLRNRELYGSLVPLLNKHRRHAVGDEFSSRCQPHAAFRFVGEVLLG